MKVFLGAAKVLALLFWLTVVVNLFEPFAQPFGLLLHFCGGLLLVINGYQLVLRSVGLREQSVLWCARALLFGPLQRDEVPMAALELAHA
ncbi:DUF1145 domain-containing protein [Pseudomonas sp. LS44]|uniref:DUF1145 domain-containing protein n=1 Tax=Pseudomonas sp. LS44 TaxID=1357074 RepID=UPI00215A4508|nr:DUF1145 domain-containing protein [Pseudomonas sp. LS44]UVE18853.1 DUF1145 domain-containing protein [Pseudomonas sp. LS44]